MDLIDAEQAIIDREAAARATIAARRAIDTKATRVERENIT